MEIELKYLVEENIARERLLGDSHLAEIMQEGSYEELNMRATYLDTAELDLMKSGIVMRIRLENDRTVATLKWNGTNEGSLHVRGEINLPVEKSFAENPQVSAFAGSEIYEAVRAAGGDKKLKSLLETNYLRRQIRVDTGSCICEVSLDVGKIITNQGNEPISELEIELYAGDKEDMLALGRELAAKYNLKEGVDSKFRRGLKLLGLA